jgi:hypothetical protein
MSAIKQVLNEALGLQEASQWGTPTEILDSVSQTLERDVEWPLTEIMDGAVVRKLLAPIQTAVNNMQHQVANGGTNEDITRLRQLSGLKVDESPGMNEENVLNQLLGKR